MKVDSKGVAIVTGGAQGIGAAVVKRLVTDGFAVAILDRNLDGAELLGTELRQAGAEVWEGSVDVADEKSVDEAVAHVVQHLGEPTVLVNNAGILRDNLLFKMSTGDWDDVVGVHLRGAFLMSRAVQAHMVTSGWGRIVNLSSTSALGNRGQANYAAAKAGIQGFTKTLALELGPRGITVNAVAPGFISTSMTRQTAERLGLTLEDLEAQSAAVTAVRRVGSPEDVANAVSFFVSEASSFLSGQVLYVSGGPNG
jgi:3-oxoacyl-[acyl-carrier protein] reductase